MKKPCDNMGRSRMSAGYGNRLSAITLLAILFIFLSTTAAACGQATPGATAVPTTRPTPTTRPQILPSRTAAQPATRPSSPTRGGTAAPPPTAVPTSTHTPAGTATATLRPGTTWVRPGDGVTMVHVPAGEFIMGMDADDGLDACRKFYSMTKCQRDWFTDEEPVHTVFLDAFWIDRVEVTNAMYARCVAAGACQLPDNPGSINRFSYYNDLKYGNFPVINVSWEDAVAYCEWAGARLPTEAEWEKAARGTEGATYPWGESDPSCRLANLDPYGNSPCQDDTLAIGSFPDGASPYGAWDMAGNVWELVADWYDANYYANSPASNPAGPASGTARVIRGGAFYVMGYAVRTTDRGQTTSAYSDNYTGFRCALTQP